MILVGGIAVTLLLAQSEALPGVPRLPAPERNPLAIDRAADPILALARESADPMRFREFIAAAVDRSPQSLEARAQISEAEAGRGEAMAGRYPVLDVALNGQQSIVRHFTNDVDVIVERSRGSSRVDATLSADQTLFDFGATDDRVAAAGARLRGAALNADAQADGIALRAVAVWYDVFTYRALVRLDEDFTASQEELREAIQTRIQSGLSAPGDLPRVESYIASAEAQLARDRRNLANAEARFEEMFGALPPAALSRAPDAPAAVASKDEAATFARSSPAVQSANASARAAREDARAQRASTYPRLSAGLDAGRYGILEEQNYDVRGRFTIRQRLFGGVDSRVEQYEARATGAEARAARVQIEAERDAAIALSDVRALEQQLVALEHSYIASRQSRDVLAERFRVARGTLFDLLEAESDYFGVAAGYVRAMTELDAARYVLLSRTGQLLPTLGIRSSGGATP